MANFCKSRIRAMTRLNCWIPAWMFGERDCCPQSRQLVQQTGWRKHSAQDTSRASIRPEPAEIRRVQGEVVPTDEEPALMNSAANLAGDTGQHHEITATWSPNAGEL